MTAPKQHGKTKRWPTLRALRRLRMPMRWPTLQALRCPRLCLRRPGLALACPVGAPPTSHAAAAATVKDPLPDLDPALYANKALSYAFSTHLD